VFEPRRETQYAPDVDEEYDERQKKDYQKGKGYTPRKETQNAQNHVCQRKRRKRIAGNAVLKKTAQTQDGAHK
jgi:hypothetical protein